MKQLFSVVTLLSLTVLPATAAETVDAVWHEPEYPCQVWLDGLYMGAPFYAEYEARFGRNATFNDIARQFSETYATLHDADTGLLYHGWDETRVQRWSDPETGRSRHVWARKLGWYAMALVDILDVMPPEKTTLRAPLLAIIPELAESLIQAQDATGVWFQIMDMPDEPGNYREASASAMSTHFLAGAINRGSLPESFKPATQKAYAGVVDGFVSLYADGSYHLTNNCELGGLGYGRDGSYRYYMSEPMVTDDPKGLGPAIMAGLQASEFSRGTVRIGGNFEASREGSGASHERKHVFRSREFSAYSGATSSVVSLRLHAQTC